jgi:acyl transferase domain-containing protein/acyl carrier protein
MQTLPTAGEMVAVFASEAQVAAVILPYAEQVTIAAVNSPREVVISGATLAVEAVVAKLTADNIETRRLNVSHAFHSPLMEPILDSFEQIAAKVFEKTAANVKYSSPKMSLVSNLTGKLMTGKEIADPEYWRRHIRESVKFAESMQTLHAQGYKVFVEIGPHPVLLGMGRRCLPDDTGVWVHSLRKGHSDWQQLLQSLGELYIHGIEVDWAGFDRDYQRQRQQLPTYPFQRSRYWIEQKTDHKHSDWLYKIEWQPKSRTLSQSASVDNEPVEHGTWLIFGDAPKGSRPKGDRHSGIGSALAKLLEKRGQTCVIVYPGDSYDSSAEGYVQINPAQPEDFQRLIKEVLSSPCHGVVHLWSLESTPTDATTLDSLQTDQLHNCGSILYLVQALASAKFHLPPLWLVTQQAQPIETENLAVAQAPIWGLGRVIALEHPEMLAGLVDIVANSAEEAAATLLEEFWQPDGEHQICWRHGKRFVARLVRSATKKALLKPLEFRADGTYLITGGLGGLGLKVAQWLVDQGVQHLVLVGRRDASVQARQQLSQLQEAGAKIVVAKADISQAEDLRRVLTDIEVALPPVRGIIHTAGVLDDGVLSKQDWNRFAKVLDPKVAGAWNLHTQTQNFPLDFFVNFSSVASIHGSLGQGSYAAANAFLDALAHYRRLRGLPALTINWSSWDEVGMAVSMSRRDQQRWKEAGVRFIPPRQGVQVLGHLLRQDSPQMSVLSVDWSKLLKLFPASFESTFLSEIASLIQSKTPVKSASQQPKLLQTLEQTPFQQRKNVLITHIQNEVAAVSGFDSSRLPKPQVGFFEMGMDSLMTLELKNRLQSNLSISLPPTLTFDYPTIEAVAEYLLNEALSLERPKSETKFQKDSQQQDQLLTEIKQLSEDELTALIDAEVNTLAKH